MHYFDESRHDGTGRFASVKHGRREAPRKSGSTLGILLSGIFLALAALVISAEGLFGGTAAIALGQPWSLVASLIDPSTDLPVAALSAFVLVPIALNATLIYGIGFAVSSVYKMVVKE